MTEKLVRENERVDDLQNGYYVIQDPEKFCFGMDHPDPSESEDYGKTIHRSGNTGRMCTDGRAQCPV